MNTQTYKKLRSAGLFGWFGSISKQGWDSQTVTELLSSQLGEEIDFNNVTIVFPVGTGYGNNGVFGPGPLNDPRRVTIDHITYWLTISKILDKKGVRFESGERLVLKKHAYMRIAQLVVCNGIAYPCQYSADPLDRKYINPPCDIEKQNIFFSGYFIRNCRDKYGISTKL